VTVFAKETTQGGSTCESLRIGTAQTKSYSGGDTTSDEFGDRGGEKSRLFTELTAKVFNRSLPDPRFKEKIKKEGVGNGGDKDSGKETNLRKSGLQLLAAKPRNAGGEGAKAMI